MGRRFATWAIEMRKGFVLAALTAAVGLAAPLASWGALIGHWTMDSDSAGLQNQGTNGAASDLVANGPLPTFNATGGFDGGGYTTFTGVEGLISTTAGNVAAALSSAGGYPFSYAAWIRLQTPVPTTGARGTILAISTTTSNGDFITMSMGYPEDRDFESNRRFGGATNLTDADGSAAALIDGGWHHVAAVFASPSSLELYVDGVLQTNNPAVVSSVTFPSTVNAVNIGVFQRSNGPTDRYRGDIDDVRIYDTALTAQEVATLAVPEANSMLLAAIGAVALFAKRRMKRAGK